MNHKNQDAVIVFNNDRLSENQLSDANKSRVQKAVDLYNERQVKNIIFVGKDVQLFAAYAKESGLDEGDITSSPNEEDIVKALYDLRTTILDKRKYKKVVFVTTSNHFSVTKFASNKIFGPTFETDFELAVSGLRGLPYDYAMKSEAEVMSKLMSTLEKVKEGSLEDLEKLLGK